MAIVEAAMRGITGGATKACHVRDYTLADDSAARAVLALNSQSNHHLPVLGYAGFTWHGFVKNDGKTVHENVEAAILAHLRSAVKNGSNIIPGLVRTSGSRSSANSASKRPAPPDSLKHCAIRGRNLPIKQSVHDVWDVVEDPTIRAAWKEVVASHNTLLNPEGTPWKSRRPAVAVETQESKAEQEAMALPPASMTVEELKVPPSLKHCCWPALALPQVQLESCALFGLEHCAEKLRPQCASLCRRPPLCMSSQCPTTTSSL